MSYETVVVDNASGFITKFLLKILYKMKFIDKIHFSKENLYFAGGNNYGASLADKKSAYYLLLNSDIEIKDSHWLQMLINNHSYGISSYGLVQDGKATRADGYCFLINKNLYDKYKLDENFKWFYGITKLQGEVLSEDNTSVKAYYNHDDIIIHYGGKSGKAYKKVNIHLNNSEIYKLLKKSDTKDICAMPAETLRETLTSN